MLPRILLLHSIIKMHIPDLEKVFKMKTIAVVGLSLKPERPSHYVSKYMLENNYEIIPVNPGHKMIFDMPCYSSLTRIPHSIDIVNIFRNSKYVFPIIKEAIGIKAKVIWLQDGIISKEGKPMAKNNNMIYIENDCILRKHRSINEL